MAGQREQAASCSACSAAPPLQDGACLPQPRLCRVGSAAGGLVSHLHHILQTLGVRGCRALHYFAAASAARLRATGGFSKRWTE